MQPYPRWRFFPGSSPPPSWVLPLIDVFSSARPAVDSLVEHDTRMQSDAVLAAIEPELIDLGYAVESGKQHAGKLHRPVFFGDEGAYLRKYEIDAFHEGYGIALEVEAGRATMGNAIYRDLIQASLMVDARFLALAVPLEYRYRNASKITREPSYDKTYRVVEAIYGSQRLKLPFDGVLLIGY